MRYLMSNLFFSSFAITGIGTFIWYLLNENSKKERQAILIVFTDFIFNFVVILFALNVVFHLKEIIEFPYRVLMFSSRVVFLATLLLTIYSALKYGEKMWIKPAKSKSVTQLFLFIGLTNHIYLYALYGNLQTIFLIAYFILLLFLISFTSVLKKVDPLLFILLSMGLHLLLIKNQPVVYLNFTFYTIPLLILTLTLVLILYYQRRNFQSKQK